jgi:transcriptional regulator of met regulon
MNLIKEILIGNTTPLTEDRTEEMVENSVKRILSEADKDVEHFFDMVLGDYLGAVADDWSEEDLQSFIEGTKKVAKAVGINPKKYDTDKFIK